MRKLGKTIWSIMIAALLCISAVTAIGFAAENVTATVPVTVTVNGSTSDVGGSVPSETYTFVMNAFENAPLPSQASISINGAGRGSFEIPFSGVGVYQYTISQDTSALTGNGVYDESVYYITVTVSYGEGGDLQAAVVSRLGNTQSEKSDITFENTYSGEEYDSLKVVKTWTDNGVKRPTSIRVQLLDGTKVVETVELSAANGWTYTWTKLDKTENHDWSVKEVAVSGYTAQYSTGEDGTITIHNKGIPTGGSLIQTGQLNWPIPVLGAIGCALILCGVYVMKKNRRKNNG
ncbi:MAG: Cna B-type domain-containing protein [Eubacteriales bacterium]|nr:Cna B-type domain-containing protein [Eubacteriales bacterium]